MRRFALVACARWESAYIQEWLLYHRFIGFQHVYLYCNDDDPADLYAQVMPFLAGDDPFVTFVHYPIQGQQFFMYLHALRHYRHETEWIMFLDIDEFLVLKNADHLAGFVDGLPPEWDSINFNWVFFGTSGFHTRPPGSVLLQYTWRAAGLHPYTKNLTRTACIDMTPFEAGARALFWHHWEADIAPSMRCVNVLGHDIRAYYQGFPETSAAYLAAPKIQGAIMQIGLIHHYHLKSEMDFARRAARGLGGDFYLQGIWQTLQADGGARAHLDETNAVQDVTLALLWQARLDHSARSSILPKPKGRNLALGRPARQSSLSEWSFGPSIEADAALATDGKITGKQTCHTATEPSPWWQVDLGEPQPLGEIRVYNRIESRPIEARINPFVLEISDDGHAWVRLYEKTDDTRVGGADGYPFIHRPAPAPTARYLRLRLLRETCLHLDQVEVYASPSE